jgi:hypothetical protein
MDGLLLQRGTANQRAAPGADRMVGCVSDKIRCGIGRRGNAILVAFAFVDQGIFCIALVSARPGELQWFFSDWLLQLVHVCLPAVACPRLRACAPLVRASPFLCSGPNCLSKNEMPVPNLPNLEGAVQAASAATKIHRRRRRVPVHRKRALLALRVISQQCCNGDGFRTKRT